MEHRKFGKLTKMCVATPETEYSTTQSYNTSPVFQDGYPNTFFSNMQSVNILDHRSVHRKALQEKIFLLNKKLQQKVILINQRYLQFQSVGQTATYQTKFKFQYTRLSEVQKQKLIKAHQKTQKQYSILAQVKEKLEKSKTQIAKSKNLMNLNLINQLETTNQILQNQTIDLITGNHEFQKQLYVFSAHYRQSLQLNLQKINRIEALRASISSLQSKNGYKRGYLNSKEQDQVKTKGEIEQISRLIDKRLSQMKIEMNFLSSN